MVKAELIYDRGYERDYRIASGNIITLVFDESEFSISFRENGEKIGDEFRFIDESSNEERYLLARMYSPIKKEGLGRAVLEFFKYITDGSIYTRPNDNIKRDDQSHLTEDALYFVGKMQEEGLIECEQENYDYYEDF